VPQPAALSSLSAGRFTRAKNVLTSASASALSSWRECWPALAARLTVVVTDRRARDGGGLRLRLRCPLLRPVGDDAAGHGAPDARGVRQAGREAGLYLSIDPGQRPRRAIVVNPSHDAVSSAAALAALLTIGSLPRPAAALDVLANGEGLLEACNELERGIRPSGGDSFSYSGGREVDQCVGFIGAMQQVSVIGTAPAPPLLGACLPPASDPLQLIRVFTTYARAHPGYLHEKPAFVVMWAFQATFPCR